MSEFVLYPGCLVQSRLPFLEAAVRFIFGELNVKADDMDGSTCCIEPVGLRSLGPSTWKHAGARIHSLAGKRKIITICDGCSMSLSEAAASISKDGGASVRDVMNSLNRKVCVTEVIGLLEFLHSRLPEIKKRIVTQIDFSLALFPGCHCESACRMRGRSAAGMLSDIVKAIGGRPVILKDGLCCGGGAAGLDAELEKNVMHESISEAKAAGAIAIVTSCPFCFLQFDMIGRQTTLHIAELVASGMGWKEDAHRHHRTK